jgi:HD-like signal output (HDOD) protein
MPATLVRLWLSISGPTIDLHAVCSAIREDLGLTLRVTHLTHANGERSSARIHEAVVQLGAADLRRLALLTPVLALNSLNPSGMQSLWHHSLLVAKTVEEIAQRDGDIDPEHAYLCGLLHDIEKLPGLLAKQNGRNAEKTAAFNTGSAPASAWNLPAFVSDTIAELAMPSPRGRLAKMILAGHNCVSICDWKSTGAWRPAEF